MSGAIRSLPNTPSWRGARLKHGDKFNLYLHLYLTQYISGNLH